MKTCWVLGSLILLLAGFSPAQADYVELDLETRNAEPACNPTTEGSWELYALIVDTQSGVDGSFGLSAVRVLLDNVNPEVTIAPGIGAIDPVDINGMPRPPVLITEGGTIDILYGQDLTESNGHSVITGIGTENRTLIASGTSPIGRTPVFGDDDSGLPSAALLLASNSSPYGSSLDPDFVALQSISWDDCFLPGDNDNSGHTGQGDLDLVLLNWGQIAPPVPAGWINNQPNGLIGQAELDDVLLSWGSGGFIAVPEPASLMLLGMALLFLAQRRLPA